MAGVYCMCEFKFTGLRRIARISWTRRSSRIRSEFPFYFCNEENELVSQHFHVLISDFYSTLVRVVQNTSGKKVELTANECRILFSFRHT